MRYLFAILVFLFAQSAHTECDERATRALDAIESELAVNLDGQSRSHMALLLNRLCRGGSVALGGESASKVYTTSGMKRSDASCEQRGIAPFVVVEVDDPDEK